MKKRQIKKLYKKEINSLNSNELMRILKDCGIKYIRKVGKNKGGIKFN